MPRQHSPRSLRPIAIHTRFLETNPASILYVSGRTKVLCVATLESGVPPFLLGAGRGWSTAEYDLLPGATRPRHPRERSGKLSGRTQEIQRFIGRSLRAVLDLAALDGWTLKIDCDVLQADGGTRTAAISGAYIAASIACREAVRDGRLARDPVRSAVAAVSVGIVAGEVLLDLDYEEDSAADVDMNVVQNGEGKFLEIQGTAEGKPFSRRELDRLLEVAEQGIAEILVVQEKALSS